MAPPVEVVVVDLGVSNVASMQACLTHLGAAPRLSTDAADVAGARLVVLPGVGAFDAGVESLARLGLLTVLADRVRQGRPTLCVCLGFQLLGRSSAEASSAEVRGMDVFPAHFEHLPAERVRVPQQGWNRVEALAGAAVLASGDAYFSNSFATTTAPVGWRHASTVHGIEFVSAVERGAVVACQFHPELSGEYGRNLVKKWLKVGKAHVVAAGAVPAPVTNGYRRVIPCLDVRNGRVVKGVKFQNLRDAGDPVEQARRYEMQGGDELVMLDISATAEERKTTVDTVKSLKAAMGMPLTVGGGVSSLDDAAKLLAAGADKVAVNTAAVNNPELLGTIATALGRQCTVLAIDASRVSPGKWEVVTRAGTHRTGKDVVEWAKEGVRLGAGEVLLTSWDQDGTRAGYDCPLIKQVSEAVAVPVIASGGAASSDHLVEALKAGADAVLAASIFHDSDTTVGEIKEEMKSKGVAVRMHPYQPSIKVETTNAQAVVPIVNIAGMAENEAVEALTKAAFAGEVLVAVRNSSAAIVNRLIQKFPCRLEGAATTAEAALELLNDGAVSVVCGEGQLELATMLPRPRVVIRVEVTRCTSGGYQTSAGVPLVEAVIQLAEVAFRIELGFTSGRVSLAAVEECVAAVADKAQLTVRGVTDAPTVAILDGLGCESVVDGKVLHLADALAACFKSDRPDGLWTTVSVDESGKALGLAYSNLKSLRASVDKGRGVYWSRNRGLWCKGDTSGAHQDLRIIQYDCDRDLICFVVKQYGKGFCHRDTYTCFGADRGVHRLMATLESRKLNAPEGSYTKRLFNDPELLKAKLVEEAIELSEAETTQHIAEEAADVMYFAMTACARGGVTFDQVERCLDKRDLKVKRRPGNAKPDFIAAYLKGDPESPPAKKGSLRRIAASEVPALHRDPVDAKARDIAEAIMKDVAEKGKSALLHHALRLGDIKDGERLVYTPAELKAVFDDLSASQQALLKRSCGRIEIFAKSQLDSILSEAVLGIAGGEAGQVVAPVEVAGCYAPGGRYPLPSSVLMGVVAARVAGVKKVWVASPRPHKIVLAAAHVAGADGLLAVGGAQAIAAFAYGAGDVPVCDAIVGPGNKFVTAAKSLVAGAVAIDMLAGPSECLVIADEHASAKVVAADLLAQAEHDVAARALLVCTSEPMIAAVDAELAQQLGDLPTKATAGVAIEKNSFAVLVSTLEEAADISNRLAPEHLEVHIEAPEKIIPLLDHYGALFVGGNAAEVLGDYAAGPNHTLPTGGTARSFGGLSVHTFLRIRTWLRVDNLTEAREMVQDAVDLALCEGLHAHSRAAALRLTGTATNGTTAAPTPATAQLRRIQSSDVPAFHRDPVDPMARDIAESILKDVRAEGEAALLRHALRLGDIKEGEPHIYSPDALRKVFESLSTAEQGLLTRSHGRIEAFAKMQVNSIKADHPCKIAGGEAGQVVAPVEVAGCYAPGGRYPLPSSVLMGVVAARVAGVKKVWVASPRPHKIVLAAAHVAGADGLLAVGGAQAIAAFAYGAGDVPVCDAIVGPGNKFVTAAKSLVAGAVAIDMLAGPSECLVIADEHASAKVVAADLLAQAEHDVAARALLVCTSEPMIAAVDAELAQQLGDLPTKATAGVAIEKNSFAVLVSTLEEAADISNRLAPEHLEVHIEAPEKIIPLLDHYGALFVGGNAAEVLGDYAAGPNHTLPTGGTARSFGGLSVHTFLRIRTWLRVDNLTEAREMVQDAVDLALCEGLHAHSRAAALRLTARTTEL